MNIIGIDLLKLRNAEFLQFSKDVLNIVNNNNIDTVPEMNIQTNDFQNRTIEIEVIFAQDLASDIRHVLEALDKRRKDAINSISLLVNALIYHFDPEIKAAAQRLANQLKLYGVGIARQNYEAETASLNNIIDDWNNKLEFVLAINILGLTVWKEGLSTANEEFNNQYIICNQQMAAQNPDKLKEKIEQSVQVYYVLRDRIVALANINDRAKPWSRVINELNAMIEQYNVLLAWRAAHSYNSAVGVSAC